MRDSIEIGVLFSRSGGYALISEACRAGALSAIGDVNADPRYGFELAAVERDPQGNIDRYAPLCDDILRNSSARHVIGCVTSWSRKEVIPVLERSGGMLWYGCPYEGFEANERVVYTHACPNQHLVPLMSWTAPRHGANGFLLGSNYIWGWETNRVARDLVADAGGEVLGERYLPLGETDVSRLIDEICATRPDFILNNLIGPSSYAFLRAYHELGLADADFLPRRRPVLSCNLTECELPALDGKADGHLAVGPYFRNAADELDWPMLGVPGRQRRCGSSFEAAAYSSVRILADVLHQEGRDAIDDFPGIFAARSFETPCGEVTIDPKTQHASLPVVIGQVNGLQFDTLHVAGRIDADPYLSRYDRNCQFARPALRVVS